MWAGFVFRNDEGDLAVDSEVCVRMYRPDGFHLTAEGHGYCADQLAKMCESWLHERHRGSCALSAAN